MGAIIDEMMILKGGQKESQICKNGIRRRKQIQNDSE